MDQRPAVADENCWNSFHTWTEHLVMEVINKNEVVVNGKLELGFAESVDFKVSLEGIILLLI